MCTWFFIVPIMIFVYMTILFIIAQYKRDNSIADIGWAGGFMLLAITSYFATSRFDLRSTFVTVLVVVWGSRLTWHIWSRHKGEDKRYQKMRESWGEFACVNAFLYVFILQGFFMFLIAMPIVLINRSSVIIPLGSLAYGALLLWVIGFLFEIIGDHQLQTFLANPENKGKICNKGLWRYTRHPNYFGEFCMWFALFLLALPVSYGWLAIISPIILILIFVQFSIPMTEAQFDDNPAYQGYKHKTSSLIPWVPRS